eukprot:NODE_60_length_25605_cov_0.732377.p2 type:complete len:743 gc:universal NODE_60_length_25605_cov_0.732377:15071-12843(-)
MFSGRCCVMMWITMNAINSLVIVYFVSPNRNMDTSSYFKDLRVGNTAKVRKTNPFNPSIPYYLEMRELNDFSEWLKTPLGSKEDNKHITRVIHDSPGMGKTSAVAHYSKCGYYVQFNVSELKDLDKAFFQKNKSLPDTMPLSLLMGEYETLFSSFTNNLLNDVYNKIITEPDEYCVVIGDIKFKNEPSRSRPVSPTRFDELRERNIILHFDEIQDWAGDLDYTKLDTTDGISKKHFSSLRISRFVKALSTTIASLNCKRIKVVMTGTSCDIHKHLTFGSSLIPSDTVLPEFNESYVHSVLDHFLTKETMDLIDSAGYCKILCGRPRNIQYFLASLYDKPYESIDDALKRAYALYSTEHDRFSGFTSRNAVFDSIVALVFYRSLGGVRVKNEIQFPRGCITENIRNLTKVGLLRVRSDSNGDILTVPYPFLIDYLKQISSNINLSYYTQLVSAAGIIRSNALTGVGVVFQVALAIELMLPSSKILQIITERSGIDLAPRLFDDLVPFSLFSDIHSNFEKVTSSVFIVQDLAQSNKNNKRYVDVACQLTSNLGSVCLRIEAKNYSNLDNDSKLRNACVSFFNECNKQSDQKIRYINAFICTKLFFSNMKRSTAVKREIQSFLDISEGNQTYIIMEDFNSEEGLILPFKELCDLNKNLHESWDTSPVFSRLKDIFHPKIVVNSLRKDDQNNLKSFLQRKYPSASVFTGYDSHGDSVCTIRMKYDYPDLMGLLNIIKVVAVVPDVV